MSNKLTYIIIVLLLLLGAWYLFQQNNQQRADITPDRSDLASGEKAEVIYTDEGYSPAILRVKPGTEVVFKNQSGAAMWTASSIHPTHLILPEFDAKVGAPVGESYSFIFTKNGEWKYHNHLKPNHGATIIVE